MSFTQIVGESSWTRSLRRLIAQAAPFPSNVLITGPSGTGKELIARAIHEQSPRSSHAFVPVDCTALSGELFASHLFGHVKGAFTGAEHARMGCFRAAQGGTIFLDEIGELSLELQSKLLRTIQERVVVPLGSDQPVKVDVRIVAATNRDLAAEVRAGRFRLDLFYRLNVVQFETIALAERRDDIEPLAVYFLHKLAVEHGYPLKRLTGEALCALNSSSWPGNVRQLQNVIERTVVFMRGDEIDARAILGGMGGDPATAPNQNAAPCQSVPPRPHDDSWPSLAEVERAHIQATLEATFFNQSAAADLLGINRARLARKIEFYRLTLPASRPGRPRLNSIVRRIAPR